MTREEDRRMLDAERCDGSLEMLAWMLCIVFVAFGIALWAVLA